MRFVRAGTVPYADAWATQRALHADRVANRVDDVCLLLEHPSVYTAGKRTEIWERPLREDTPVVDVDRGGKITWHGPGQLVGYPIVKLPDPIDVVGHVRRIEQALIDVCAAHGVPEAARIEGRSGVWVGNAKVAAIGIRVSQGVTMHGFALNCDCDLTAFDDIVPCGIADAGVTSLTRLTGRTITTDDVVDTVEAALVEALDPVRG